jgi:tyrosine-specific transport protein
MVKKKTAKQYWIASSIIIGSCIGAGVLGIPYVAAQAGFFVVLLYIFLVGLLIYAVNSFLGEVILRTKGDHQLIGYVEKYLGLRARHVMEFAFVFGGYAAMVAYMLGMGKSLSFLFFGNTSYEILFGVLVGLMFTYLLYGGVSSLKKFEKIGVLIILSLLLVIVLFFVPKVVLINLLNFDKKNILLPFGVVLFALMSFDALPEVKIVLKGKEKLFRKVLLTGTLTSMIFYAIFTFVVLGFKGINTPEVATLTLGSIFILMGMFTMFTSYLTKGNALSESFEFDERYDKKKSWLLASFVPIGIFLLTQMTDFFSFTRILSLGGVVSGGIIAILSLLMVRKAKTYGNRKPEYSVHAGWGAIVFLTLIFVLGVLMELFF